MVRTPAEEADEDFSSLGLDLSRSTPETSYFEEKHPTPALQPIASTGSTPVYPSHQDWPRNAESYALLLRGRTPGNRYRSPDGEVIPDQVDVPAPRAQALFDEMVFRHIRPTAQHYLALMNAYAKSGEVASAVRVLSAAVAAGIVTTLAMATVLIVGYANAGKPHLSEQVFLNMQKAGAAGLSGGAGSSGIQPDVASVDALARAYISAGRPSDARRVVLQHWASVDQSYLLRKDSPKFMASLHKLTLKALLYALAHLPGAQRKGGTKGQAFSTVRRIATMALVRRVVRTWKGETPAGAGPRVPRLTAARHTRPPLSEESQRPHFIPTSKVDS